MKFGSLFAGIGGFDLGFERAGMTCVWQGEIGKFCNGILEKHWPKVERYGDVKECGKNLEQVELICGGFPCQDVSVAGRREGLAGSKSGLWFEFYRILEELRPRWVVIENVPGLLSSNKGRDFATILQGLAELRYLSAWRILDAQYFGVAQRRRRVFIIGHLGGGRAAQVLFEPTCGPRDTPPSRETREGVASFAPGSFGEYRKGLTTLRVGGGNDSQGLIAFQAKASATQSMNPSHTVPTLDVCKAAGSSIAYTVNYVDDGRKDRPNGGMYIGKVDTALTPASKGQTLIASTLVSPHKQWNSAQALPNLQITGYGVRRLTPTECERLQGFPDGWTATQSDTRRYKQLGNAVCVSVAEWLGRRIMQFK